MARGSGADPHRVESVDALEALYGAVNPNSLRKEVPHLTDAYARWIEQARFVALASVGPGGLDCSPRGDETGRLVHVLDERTLALPDRRGNNRLDTLRNLLADPRVALLFLIPGVREALRVNGHATITTDPALIERFTHDRHPPATVVRVAIEAVYFQCARSILRASLWPAQSPPAGVPSAGEMLAGATPGISGADYDAALPARQRESLY